MLLTKPKFSMATAPASVTTDRLTPRTRTAEIAVIRPMTTATAMPASAATGNVMPKLTAMCYILSHGELAASGRAEQLSKDRALLAASYLGQPQP